MDQTRNVFKELRDALIGAAITSGVQLLFLLRPGAVLDWRSLALAAITGALIGWGYRLATGLRTASDRALRELGDVVESALTRLERTTEALDVQQETLKLLLSAKIHKEVIWKLVTASFEGPYKYLANVSENRYLDYLRTAISASNRSVGVKRAPIRSYKESANEVTERYLHTLRDRPMEKKIRIFIIDSDDEQAMKDDLDNPEMMDFYWGHAGKDVESYWITTPEFNSNNFYRGNVPKEFAIYDDELLIEYDKSHRTLAFAVIKEDEDRLKIFEELAEQERNDLPRPFRKITLPTGSGSR
jgi:hypothetical protein